MENRINDIETKHHFNSGVYSREMRFPKGWFVESHKHCFDHMSILAQGKVKLIVNDEEFIYEAPYVLNIKKDTQHRIEALEDSVWFCIHVTQGTNVTSVEEVEQILIKNKE